MNTTLKTTLALGTAALSLLALAGGASAQTTVGDPNLKTDFSTYSGAGQPNFSGAAIGVGFDPNGGGGKLSLSESQGTAQSLYEAFTFDSSAAGAFTTLASGSTAQIQLFAANNNVNSTGGATNPFDIYATLYAYSPAAGAVPVTGPDLFGMPEKITLGANPGGYFSGDFKLTGSLTAGDSYVLGLTTLNNDTQDFAQVAMTVNGQAKLTTTDFGFSTANKFVTRVDDQGTPGGSVANPAGGLNVVAFRLDAAPPAAVPEASSVVSMGLLLGLGAAFIAFKRRRTAA